MKKSITLKLINNERKNSRILSANSCSIDKAVCAIGATDICINEDYAGCYMQNTYDYCKYFDAAACSNGVSDTCEYDFNGCYGNSSDFCSYDS